MSQQADPVDITKAGLAHAKENGFDTIIVDTAGRQVVDDYLMVELKNIQVGLACPFTTVVLLFGGGCGLRSIILCKYIFFILSVPLETFSAHASKVVLPMNYVDAVTLHHNWRSTF